MNDDKSPKVEMRFEDKATVAETFADTVGQWHFDGSTLRMDFLVTRFDHATTPEKRTGRRVPTCRLVLSANGAIELLNECRRIAGALEKAGLLKKGETEPKRTN